MLLFGRLNPNVCDIFIDLFVRYKQSGAGLVHDDDVFCCYAGLRSVKAQVPPLAPFTSMICYRGNSEVASVPCMST